MPKVVTAFISRDAGNRTELSRGGREAWNEGDKWRGRRLPHMVDKRRQIQLKLLG